MTVANNYGLSKKRTVPGASAILDDGTIVEMVYRPELRRTFFAVYSTGRWTVRDAVEIDPDTKLVPFSPNNNLVKNEVVLLPSEPLMYGGEGKLVTDIRGFIRKYVDFSEVFENVATHYVLLTWLYDAFNELPYLRLRGDYGSGKTRALSLRSARSATKASSRAALQRSRRSSTPSTRSAAA